MKAKYLFGIVAISLGLTACENYFDEHELQNERTITDVSTKNYTLTDNDYKKISTNAKNIEIAYTADSLANDTTNKPAQTALTAVGKNHYFTEAASADVYLPAFVANMYPNLDPGSIVNITFNQYEEKISARNYTLFNDDYKEIWGGAANLYVSPGSEEAYKAWLDAKFTDAANGAFMIVQYHYQNIEPLPYVVTIADILYAQDAIEHEVSGKVGKIVEPFQGYCWLVDGNDSIYVCGLQDSDGNKYGVIDKLGIKTGDDLTLHGTYDASYTACPALGLSTIVSHSTPSPRRGALEPVVKEERVHLYQYDLAAKQWNQLSDELFLPQSVYDALGSDKIEHPETVIDIYLRNKYPYAVEDESYKVVYYDGNHYVLDNYSFDGSNFIAEPTTVQETLSFEIKEDTWKADVSTFFKQGVVGDGQGKLVIVNVDLGSLNYIWAYSAMYGMKGTTYLGGPHPGEAWVVTPAIKLKKAVAPALNFDHAINYGPQDEKRQEEMSVWVSTNFDGATINPDDWTRLPWNKFNKETGTGFQEDNSWTFYNSGDMDLTEWAGQTIYIGWRYHAEEGWTCSTWEFKNILVHETAQEE